MPEKPTNKDRLKEITDSIEKGIKELFESDKYRQYLKVASKFHSYSVNNQILIMLQCPNATRVAGFGAWKDKFERNVKKGAHGIKIIAPTPYKRTVEKEKLDPDTKLPLLDAEGRVITEEKVIKIPMYRPVTVFDVSATEGKPLPELAETLVGDVKNYDVFMDALKRSSPVPIEFQPLREGMDGYFSLDDQKIVISTGMSEVQTVCAAIHEIAHSKLHNTRESEPKEEWKLVMIGDDGAKAVLMGGFTAKADAEKEAEARGWVYTDENQCEWRLEVAEDTYAAEAVKKGRGTEEIEAESIAFSVCAYYGIDTGGNSLGYIAGWSQNKELPELRRSLETINKTSSALIVDIDRNYSDIMKERGIGKAVETIASSGTEPSYEYKLHANPRSADISDAAFIQAYRREPDKLIPDEVIGIGSYEALIPLTNKLNAEKPEPETAIKLFDSQNADEAERVSEIAVEEPVPDPAMSVAAMNAYGYTDSDMLPLSKERALELLADDVTVYTLHGDNTEAMAFDENDIINHSGIFGITREDWDAAREKYPPREDKSETERRFLESPDDSYAIYQLSAEDDTAGLRFMGSDWLDKKNLTVERGNYDIVYSGKLPDTGDTMTRLNDLYRIFNTERPADFKGHSLSVSDIVALRQDGVVSCHYVDSWGFKELPAFFKPENYLKNAEMSMEDDYGMIDGQINNGQKQPTVSELEEQAKSGQPISLPELAEAVKREKAEKRQADGKKPSVLAKLKAYQAAESPKNPTQKSNERDI